VKANAERLRADMEQRYGTAKLLQRAEDPTIWRVLVGAETSPDAATALRERIREDSVEKTAGFVVRMN
jgi:hypothetical protein